MRGALLARHWEIQAKRSTFPSLWFGENMSLFPPHNLSTVIFCWVSPQPTCCWILRLCEKDGLNTSLAVKGRDKWLFLATSSKEMVCFPWVSDCSGPVECKHAVMCGVALDAVDPLQAISGPWGLRFDSTVLSLCSVFHPLKFPLSSPPLPWWNWHFSVSSILSWILEAQLFLPDGNLWLWHEKSK